MVEVGDASGGVGGPFGRSGADAALGGLAWPKGADGEPRQGLRRQGKHGARRLAHNETRGGPGRQKG